MDKMNKTDARETYEMLRAAHTLLRMAFGAVAMSKQPKDKKEAESITKPFDKVFKTIGDAATYYLTIAESGDNAGSEKPNN